MNFIKPVFFSISILFGINQGAYAASEKVAFVHVNDDSGVQTDMEIVPELRMQTLGQFKSLKKKGRKFAKAEFVLISTSYARPVWYGKISDLSTARAGELIEITANSPKNCNQLAASFEAVRNTVVQLSSQGFTEIHISVFSSLIDTPVPCDDIKITLPRLPVPIDWASSFAPTSQVQSVTFYAVNAHQHPLYAQAMTPLAIWAEKNHKHFAIHDIQSSLNVLRFGLNGVEK